MPPGGSEAGEGGPVDVRSLPQPSGLPSFAFQSNFSMQVRMRCLP